ncbi:MFS transporter [Lactiplantibacillus carotarum]|uniref:MFS transporter n=1 Tax=Lactiplantibacillus carotarum TaxID=2993456 RepID=UPI00298EDFCB|nr:MFS transporter [Lactiplantibacillus carotarum]
MLTILKNRTLQALASANFFATLGGSLFGIILLTYAQQLPRARWFVATVSIATVLPSVMGSLTGRVADQTRHKRRWLIGIKFVQAGLFIGLAQLINRQTVGVFFVVIGINLMVSLLGNYGGNLLTIIIQNRIRPADRQQVLGLNQSVSTVMGPLGQALGVLVLARTHNYALAGYLNAASFLLSAGCLLLGRSAIQPTLTSRPQAQPFHRIWAVIQRVTMQTAGMSAVRLLGVVMLLNVVDTSLDGVLNLYYLTLAPRLRLGYSWLVLLSNVAFVVGMVLGGVTKRTWLDRLTIQQLLQVCSLILMGAFATLLWWPQLVPILLVVLLNAFCTGKLDPKVFAAMMPEIEPQLVGSVFGTISSLVTVAAPIGSVGILILYNLTGPVMAFSVALGIGGLTLIGTWYGSD